MGFWLISLDKLTNQEHSPDIGKMEILTTEKELRSLTFSNKGTSFDRL